MITINIIDIAYILLVIASSLIVFALIKFRYKVSEKFFIRKIVKDNKNVKFVKMKRTSNGLYYISFHCRYYVYIVDDMTQTHIYGAKMQSIDDDLCFMLGLDRGSLYSTTKNVDTVIFKIKEKLA